MRNKANYQMIIRGRDMMKKKILSVLLCMGLMVQGMFGALDVSAAVQAEDLMQEVQAGEVGTDADTTAGNAAVSDFSVRLLQKCMENGENSLISPVSVLYALAMTANGAKGNTLSQMEETLGMPVSGLNDYFYAYMASFSAEEKCKLLLANSIWFKDVGTFQVNPDFLQVNADYYNASLYKAPFDEATKDDINAWVSEHTDSMIEEIIDEIPDAVVMYLINAVCFDAQWEEPYLESEQGKGTFTLEDGQTRETEFMYSGESTYLKDEKAEGFLKYYADKKYAFAALLPDESTSVKEYVDSLTGEHLTQLLTNAEKTAVDAAIPKFSSEYDVNMNEVLKQMGITDAFDKAKADLSGIGQSSEGQLYISRVLHKTFIDVDEQGTKAGASTAVEIAVESAMLSEKQIYLDRPFVYIIIDCQTNTPVFIGTMMDIQK